MMDIHFYIARTNRLPVIQDALKDPTGAALDLTAPNVTGVTFAMRAFATDSLVINYQAAVIVDGLTGQVRYDWSVNDSNLPSGFYRARWRVTYSSGKTLDVPNNGHLTIELAPSL